MSSEQLAELPEDYDDTEDVLLVGNAGVPRFLAAQLDHAVAIILFFTAGMSLPRYVGELIGGCSAFGVYIGYYFLTEWLLGATLGKLLSNLHVRQISGARCTAGQIAIRTLLRLVEVNILFLGALPAGIAVLSTKRHQRIGDLLAGTVVVPLGARASGRGVTVRSNR